VASRKRQRREFGNVQQLASGRWRARYCLEDGTYRNAPRTFDGVRAAEAWLAAERGAILKGRDRDPEPPGAHVTFAEYAEEWLAGRDLKPRTAADYRRMLDRHLLPHLGRLALTDVTPRVVEQWHARLGTETGPVQRARCYQLLSVITRTAWRQELITSTPCRLEGASNPRRSVTITVATPDELTKIVAATPERYRLFVHLAAWCQLRQGELVELRRRDVDTGAGTLRVERAVTRVGGRQVVGSPKSAAGTRTVTIPPVLMPLVLDHLERWAQPGPDGLLFPSQHGRQMQPSTVYSWWYPAREAAKRPDLRLHDLRHTGAVMWAQEGATLAELMARLGHSTAAAAMRYQHAASGRDAELAARVSARIALAAG
jgi:integrase